MREAVVRLGIEYPVVIDVEHEIWKEYENLGWPARYLFTGESALFEYHYGEGAYAETELAIQELLGVPTRNGGAQRPEEAPGARLAAPTDQVDGAYNGPYEAGGVWAVLEGAGQVTVNGRTIEVEHPGAYELSATSRAPPVSCSWSSHRACGAKRCASRRGCAGGRTGSSSRLISWGGRLSSARSTANPAR